MKKKCLEEYGPSAGSSVMEMTAARGYWQSAMRRLVMISGIIALSMSRLVPELDPAMKQLTWQHSMAVDGPSMGPDGNSGGK
eukprot:g36166.t1